MSKKKESQILLDNLLKESKNCINKTYKLLDKTEEITSEKGEITDVLFLYDLREGYSFNTESHFYQIKIFNGSVDFELEKDNKFEKIKFASESDSILIDKNVKVKILTATDGIKIVLVKRSIYA